MDITKPICALYMYRMRRYTWNSPPQFDAAPDLDFSKLIVDFSCFSAIPVLKRFPLLFLNTQSFFPLELCANDFQCSVDPRLLMADAISLITYIRKTHFRLIIQLIVSS